MPLFLFLYSIPNAPSAQAQNEYCGDTDNPTAGPIIEIDLALYNTYSSAFGNATITVPYGTVLDGTVTVITTTDVGDWGFSYPGGSFDQIKAGTPTTTQAFSTIPLTSGPESIVAYAQEWCTIGIPPPTMEIEGSATLTITINVLPPPSPPNGTINVVSNLNTDWIINGPANFSGSGTSGGPYSAPSGDYTITNVPDFPCYTKDITPATTQFLPAGGNILFTITYTNSCAPNYTLTVNKNGTGTGTVSSSPVGISCGGDCSEAYAEGTVVTLTATPSGGSVFAGWVGGGCSGIGTCVVTMNSDLTVTATFNLAGCSFSINPSSQNFTAAGGNGTITVTTAAGCAWNASESLSWVSNLSPASGNGNGSVTYSVAANAGSARSGTMTVAGQTFTVTQDGAASSGVINFNINYILKPLNASTAVTVSHICAAPVPFEKMNIAWNYTSNGAEDGFTVYRSTDDTNWNAIATLYPGGAATRTYQDTPPQVNRTYYYMVRTHRAIAAAPQESVNSNSASALNTPCQGNLSSSTKTYTSDVSNVKEGDTISYRITLVNSGPAAVTINYICDYPSSNLTNLRNLFVDKGSGPVAATITQVSPDCPGGVRFGISGVKNVSPVPDPFNWVITFDGTFTAASPGDIQELVDNYGVIDCTNIDGSSCDKTVLAPTILVNTSKPKVPTFREVAP